MHTEFKKIKIKQFRLENVHFRFRVKNTTYSENV